MDSWKCEKVHALGNKGALLEGMSLQSSSPAPEDEWCIASLWL